MLTTRPHLNLDNSSLEEIEERYADRTFNAETYTALNERPTRRFRSATETLSSIKT